MEGKWGWFLGGVKGWITSKNIIKIFQWTNKAIYLKTKMVAFYNICILSKSITFILYKAVKLWQDIHDM